MAQLQRFKYLDMTRDKFEINKISVKNLFNDGQDDMMILLHKCTVGKIYTPIFSFFRKKSCQHRDFRAETGLK